MATSGTSAFITTRNQVIREAALLTRFVARGVALSGEMITDLNYTLNGMVKHWQGQELHVWTETEGILFPRPGQILYSAGPTATDHITASYVKTAITADEAGGQNVIGLDDTTDITIADAIGIVLDDGTLHWTSIVSKTVSTVNITVALTDSAAAGNAVFTYTSKIGVKPIKVLNCRRYDIDADSETPVSSISRKEWTNISNKRNAGSLNEVYYDKQLSTGYFNVWGVPAATTELLYFTWQRPIMDFAAAGDNPDLPQEWIQTLQYNLAKLLLPRAVMPPEDKKLIITMADEFLADMKGFDREEGSIFIQPEMR